jgi:phosphatidylserine/phosphatidylglycerophosphate/cardiolipin synthase-like enzyme
MRILILFTLVIIAGCGNNKPLFPKADNNNCMSPPAAAPSLSKHLQPFTEIAKVKSGVCVLEDGGNSLVVRGWLSENAERSIDVQYFIFSADNVGLIACDYLVRAADRGVKVRILVDDVMVEAGAHELLTLESHKNISIKIYNPGTNIGKNLGKKAYNLVTNFRGINQRMHNKTFIVDGKVVITGGRNVADEYFDYDHQYNFRDRDVLLLGKATRSVQLSFNEFWESSFSVPVTRLVSEKQEPATDSLKFRKLHQYACNPENFWPQVRESIKNLPDTFDSLKRSDEFKWVDSVRFVSDIPGKNDGSKGLGGGGRSTDALVSLIRQAKTSIDIQSPYLVTSDLSHQLFTEAVKRGVKIRILTNSLTSTDNIEAFSGYQRNRRKILATGVRIFEFRPDAAVRYTVMSRNLQEKLKYAPIFGLHAKSMIVDGKITVIGTFNLDPRSANLNTECISVIYSEDITRGVLKGFEEEFKPENSWETTSAWNPDHKAGMKKRANTWTRKAIPKAIL